MVDNRSDDSLDHASNRYQFRTQAAYEEDDQYEARCAVRLICLINNHVASVRSESSFFVHTEVCSYYYFNCRKIALLIFSFWRMLESFIGSELKLGSCLFRVL